MRPARKKKKKKEERLLMTLINQFNSF